MTNRGAETAGDERLDVTIVERIRAEYVEMPGLSLTVRQAARFWGLSTPASEQLLSAPAECGFLVCDRKGCYRRR
jgi:hypothetical protein